MPDERAAQLLRKITEEIAYYLTDPPDGAGAPDAGVEFFESASDWQALVTKVERMREALAFYARGYTKGSAQYRDDCTQSTSTAYPRHGRRAREALDA